MNFKSGLVNIGCENFRRALAISLMLHAMLLWQKWPLATGSSSQAWPSRQAMGLNVSLRKHNEPPAVAVISPADPAEKPKVLSRQNKPTPALRQAALPHPPQPVAEVAAPAGDGLDANGIRQYRLSLAAEARRYKLYPAQALANGWSGTAEVRLAVAANGAALPVQLLRSSGHELLDAAAVEMVGNAAQRAALPASLRGRSFSLPLPVIFDHNDQ